MTKFEQLPRTSLANRSASIRFGFRSTKLLSDASPRIRCQAALALKSMAAKSRAAVPELTRALGDSVPYVRAGAADALGAIGPASRDAVPALIERLRADPGPNYVLDSAIYALGDIGADAKAAIPELAQISRRPRLTSPAREAILKIEGKPVPKYHSRNPQNPVDTATCEKERRTEFFEKVPLTAQSGDYFRKYPLAPGPNRLATRFAVAINNLKKPIDERLEDRWTRMRTP